MLIYATVMKVAERLNIGVEQVCQLPPWGVGPLIGSLIDAKITTDSEVGTKYFSN